MDINSVNPGSAGGTNPSSFDSFMGSFNTSSSAASGLLGLLDGIFDFSGKRQEKHQKNLMSESQKYWDQQHDTLLADQLDQWNRENEYNDPTNYYKRLFAASDANGLSKQAVLSGDLPGSVGLSSHNSMPPSGSGVSSPGGSTLLPIGNTASLANLKQRAEISNIESLSNLYDKEAGLADSRTTTEQLEWSVRDSVVRLNDSLSGHAQSQTALNRVLSDIQNINKDYASQFNEASINELNARAASAFASVKEIISRANLNDAYRNQVSYDIQRIMSEVALNAAYRKLVSANAGISQAELKVIDRNFAQFASALKATWATQETNASIAGHTEQRVSWDLDNYSTDKALSQFSSLMNSIGIALSFGTSYGRIFQRGSGSSSDRNKPRTREIYDGEGTLRRVEHSY